LEKFEQCKFVKSKVFTIELVPLFLATILQVKFKIINLRGIAASIFKLHALRSQYKVTTRTLGMSRQFSLRWPVGGIRNGFSSHSNFLGFRV